MCTWKWSPKCLRWELFQQRFVSLTIAGLVMDVASEAAQRKPPLFLYYPSSFIAYIVQPWDIGSPQISHAPRSSRNILSVSGWTISSDGHQVQGGHSDEIPFHIGKYQEFWTGKENLLLLAFTRKNIVDPIMKLLSSIGDIMNRMTGHCVRLGGKLLIKGLTTCSYKVGVSWTMIIL